MKEGSHKMIPKQWMYNPNSGGMKIPPAVQADVEKRIRDAYTEPVLTDGWPPADWPETREEYAERLRNTPTHLCRLRYFGNDEWGFAFYTYSNEKYELSVYDDGQFIGKPERAFLISANAYLNE